MHSEFDFKTLRVRLGPDKGRVDKFDFVQALDALETNRKKLLALRLARDPRLGWVQVSSAGSAILKRYLLRYALCDVDARADAIRTHRRWVPHLLSSVRQRTSLEHMRR